MAKRIFRVLTASTAIAAVIGYSALARTWALAGVDLMLTDIVTTVNCGTDYRCSMYFDNYVCNSDPSNPHGFTVGSAWSGSGGISTCTGGWDSSDSTTLLANQCKYVRTYGPGFVGPKVPKGVYMTVTSHADIYCQVSETNENNNSFAKQFQVVPQ
jgi:hypothetical protein